MNAEAVRAAELETAFLTGAEANLNTAKYAAVPGAQWTWRSVTQEERLRELLVERHKYDRDLLKALPKNTSRIITGTRPRFLFGRKRSGVGVASFVSPLEAYLDEKPAAPMSLSALLAHVRELVGEPDVPHIVGVCSPTGFAEDARRGGLELPNVRLVLIEPREEGGWNAIAATTSATPADCRIFDPEALNHKIQRIRQEVEARSADLITGGLSAADLAARTGVPAKVVATALEKLAAEDRELRLSGRGEDLLLYRGAPARQEDEPMSMVDWIRQLFGGEGNEARKINVLAERRAKLVQRRDRMYSEMGQLETREADLLRQGRETTSPAVKRRVASQIKQLRDDLGRMNAGARMLGQQVEVISTHIHNLSLIQQGRLAKLPSSQEVTEDAVRAEELLEQLGADVQLAGSLNVGAGTEALSADEAAILRELEQPAPAKEKEAPAPAAERPTAREPDRPEPQAG